MVCIMSRKVILFIATSIDGYIADKQGGVDWLPTDTTSNSEEDNTYETFYQAVDTVIMGRTTYDQVVNELSPEHYPYEGKASYVLTSRPGDGKEDIHFTSEPVVALVERLKNEQGGNIWIVGGSSVVKPLVEKNLIDEYQIAIAPIILGKGIPLFQTMNQSVALKLKKTQAINQFSYLTFTAK